MMKSVALKANLALNVVLGICLIMAAMRSNTVGAPAPVKTVQRVGNFAKTAGMAAAVGGLSTMAGQAPAMAHEYNRPQMTQQYTMNRDFQFQQQAPQLVQQTAEVTPSLKRYFLSLVGGGVVVGGIYAALAAVAKFDQIERS